MTLTMCLDVCKARLSIIQNGNLIISKSALYQILASFHLKIYHIEFSRIIKLQSFIHAIFPFSESNYQRDILPLEYL
jgi:hypothetical protein